MAVMAEPSGEIVTGPADGPKRLRGAVGGKEMVQITAAVSNRPDRREIHIFDSDRFRSIRRAGAGHNASEILEAGRGVVAEAHPAVELSELAEHRCSIIADACGFQVIGVGVAGRDAQIPQSIGGIPHEPMNVSAIQIVMAGDDGPILVDCGRVSLAGWCLPEKTRGR